MLFVKCFRQPKNVFLGGDFTAFSKNVFGIFFDKSVQLCFEERVWSLPPLDKVAQTRAAFAVLASETELYPQDSLDADDTGLWDPGVRGWGLVARRISS